MIEHRDKIERARAVGIAAALDLEAVARERPPSPSRRWFVVGDPQTSTGTFFEVLARYDLLGDDGWLRDDAGLVSMGDHFDFGGPPVEVVEAHGRHILAWLAAHPRDQTIILAGNHDLSRVMELAFETDASFQQARSLAGRVEEATESRRELEESFAKAFPNIPTPGIAARDYSSFSVAQRSLVEQLLLARRMRLATSAVLPGGREALFTHAGITIRELAMLEMSDERAPGTLAAALEAWFHDAVDVARPRWSRGERWALDLRPLHVAGTTGREGGGLLYHRPARRDRPELVDGQWALDAESPRRFEPASLPSGLVQVAGHSSHKRLKKELAGWVDPSVREALHVSVRTLRVEPGEPRYVGGLSVSGDLVAGLVLVDPHFASVEGAEDHEDIRASFELLRLEGPPV